MCLGVPLIPIPKSLLSPSHPIPATHDRHDPIHGTHVIHVTRGDWIRRRERIHDERERRPDQQHPIRQEAHGAHPERAVGNIIPAADQKTDDWDCVADVKQYDACSDHGVEGRAGAEIKTPEHGDYGTGDEVRVKRDVESGMHAS